MVTKVAEAINRADVEFRTNNKASYDYAKRSYESMARAAIEAMREPTNDQANEYYKIRKSCADSDIMACFNVSVWESMIDAALK